MNLIKLAHRHLNQRSSLYVELNVDFMVDSNTAELYNFTGSLAKFYVLRRDTVEHENRSLKPAPTLAVSMQ